MEEDAKIIFASNLNRLLSLRGKQQIDIARELDVSTATVSDWCNGKKYPRIDKMQRIADFLGVGLSALVTADGLEKALSMWNLSVDEQQLVTAYRQSDPTATAAYQDKEMHTIPQIAIMGRGMEQLTPEQRTLVVDMMRPLFKSYFNVDLPTEDNV